MKIPAVAKKTLLELIREPQLLFIGFGFAVILLSIYYVAFGETEKGMSDLLKVLVVNNDTDVDYKETHRNIGNEFVDELKGITFDGKPVLDVTRVTNHKAAEISLKEGKASLMLVLPADLSQALLGGFPNNTKTGKPSVISFVGDTASSNFGFAGSYIEDQFSQFARKTLNTSENVHFDIEFLPGTGTLSDLQFGVPGIIIFCILFLAMTTATTLVRDDASGTLKRLKLTGMTAIPLLSGVAIAQMVLAAFQVPLTFLAALAFGFKATGSLFLAVGIGGLLSLAAVGIGLIVASLSRTDGEAADIAAIILVPMAFLSGALFPMPKAPLATLWGHVIQIYDILPPTHAVSAMRRVLVFGEGPGAIAFELSTLTVLSLLYLIAGVALYQRRRLR